MIDLFYSNDVLFKLYSSGAGIYINLFDVVEAILGDIHRKPILTRCANTSPTIFAKILYDILSTKMIVHQQTGQLGEYFSLQIICRFLELSFN